MVTDDAEKLSEQLKRATGKRVAALDGVAREPAHEAVLGSEPSENREVRRAGRMDGGTTPIFSRSGCTSPGICRGM